MNEGVSVRLESIFLKFTLSFPKLLSLLVIVGCISQPFPGDQGSTIDSCCDKRLVIHLSSMLD